MFVYTNHQGEEEVIKAEPDGVARGDEPARELTIHILNLPSRKPNLKQENLCHEYFYSVPLLLGGCGCKDEVSYGPLGGCQAN